MTSPRKAAGRGRRDPNLLSAGGIELPLPDEIEDHQTNPAEANEELPDALLVDGDLLTASVTLAIDLLDTGHTSFVSYKATTRVLEGEHHAVTFSRVATVVGDSVAAGAEDAAARLEEYYDQRDARLAEATRRR